MDIYGSPIFTDFLVHVKVNGDQIVYKGEGEGRANEGIVNVGIRTEDNIPSGFNIALLSFVLITGQPDVSQSQDGVINPFRASLGAYNGVRTLSLGSNGKLVAEYSVSSPQGNRRNAEFVITGDVNIDGQITGIDPTTETWHQESSHELKGRFDMQWLTAEGKKISGAVESFYRLPSTVEMRGSLSRTIEFEIVAKEREMFQSETIRLYHAQAR